MEECRQPHPYPLVSWSLYRHSINRRGHWPLILGTKLTFEKKVYIIEGRKLIEHWSNILKIEGIFCNITDSLPLENFRLITNNLGLNKFLKFILQISHKYSNMVYDQHKDPRLYYYN